MYLEYIKKKILEIGVRGPGLSGASPISSSFLVSGDVLAEAVLAKAVLEDVLEVGLQEVLEVTSSSTFRADNTFYIKQIEE
jgi:hypothetical protein